jgi:hypothetical protein
MSTVLEMKDEWVKTASLFGDVEAVMTDALLTTYLQSQIRACDQEIETYELKYRMIFAEFVEAWEQGAIADRWSHLWSGTIWNGKVWKRKGGSG